ncbi:MAG TPA: RDD family protein [Chitinophagaceae bacterium]|nr:RDD family protein [Chitinophagaceae bacterium]
MQQDKQNDLFGEAGPELPYASFWKRFGAAFIDGLILMIVNFFVSFLFGEGSFYGLSFSVRMGMGGILAQIAAGWLYFALQESSVSGATPGKRALGIRVADEQGNRISFGRATARHFSKWISAIILFVGYLMMIWDDRNQALHDKIAGTSVLHYQH